jgi:hypothetical protein
MIRHFAYSYVDLDEATPRTEYSGVVKAEDSIHAALIVMSENYLDGSPRTQVYGVFECEL